ncbi:MAG: C4-dicarboxylate ABC transporter permease [Alphaproteobacteria bacterium]|nr:MAG: C4-dicarboxylate ABC transporter permease [Alphaproteobacteria bacterium]
MNALRSHLDRGLRHTIALLLAGMVLNVVWQVFTRFVLQTPSSYTEELARYTMIWLGLLGAAYCAGRRTHLALDLLPGALHGGRRRALAVLIEGLILLFALTVLVGGGGRLVWISLQLGQTSAALQLKLGYVYLALPLSGLVIALYAGLALVDALRGREPGQGGSA